jgi:hypothetical protein
MIRILITLALLSLTGHSSIASVLSFVKNDVYSLKDTNKAIAILNDKIESDSQVGTGEHSMCEISLDDKSITRIGANSMFSFVQKERLVKCDKGTFLVSKDPETETMTVTTGSVTAAVNGSTVVFDVRDDATHIAVAETSTGVVVTDKNGKSITLQSGEGISATPNGMTSSSPKSVDVKDLISSSPLFNEKGLAPLANDALIKGVASAQEMAKSQGMSFKSEINDIVANRTDSTSVPDIDTASGTENTTSNSTPPSSPQINPQLIPPVNSMPNPKEATPI